MDSLCETAPLPEALLESMPQTKKRILVVDDDPSIRDMLERYLGKQGFMVRAAGDSTVMNQLMAVYSFDLVVLDLMLAGEDGLSLAKQIRERSNMPIIILSAMGDVVNRIIGLEMGADDYLTKPFNLRELLARIKSLMRRSELKNGRSADGAAVVKTARFAGWSLNRASREVWSNEIECINLTSGLFDLLLVFTTNPQRTLSREQLLDFVKGDSRYPFDRSVDIQIMRLRRKIENDPTNPRLIKTVHGAGYIFTPTVEWS